jgi:hypothetical protein
MLTIDDKKRMVERFLSGEMRQPELAAFTAALEHDSELRLLLDAESGMEGLLHDALKAPLSVMQYETLTDRTLGLTKEKTASGGDRWLHIYAIAATLLIMVMGGYTFITSKNMKNVTAGVNAPLPSRTVTTPHKMRSGKTIIHVTPTTLLLAEEGTKSHVIHDGDSAIQIVISQGNACFDVAKNEQLPITVATPHTAITLNGSVTRIVVTELETEVSVLEGEVEVVHRYDQDAARELPVGASIFADFKTLQAAEALAPAVCESRTTIFRAYVAWVQQQAHG